MSQKLKTEQKQKVEYVTVEISLPKKIVEFYHFVATMNPQDHKDAECLMAEDLMDSLESEFEGREPTSWKELFNLTDSFEDMKREAKAEN